LLALIVPLASACGGGGEAAPGGGPGGDGSLGGDGASADGSGDGHGDGNGDGAGDGNGSGAGDGDDDPLTEESACAASTLAAEQVVVEEEVEVEVEVEVPEPVALYVMFDKSMSMSWGDLWEPAVDALQGFVGSAASSGIDLGIQYFPNGGSCDTGSGYSTPAVALGRLPGHADAIIDSLTGQEPDGFGTPIEGALRGVTEYCKGFQSSHADEDCVAVLITDGKPEYASGCEENHDKLAAIAGKAWTDHGVRTFAVGLAGADFGLLDKIAKAGGAADCDPESSRFSCDVSDGAGKLEQALAKIRDTVTTTEVRTEIQTRTESRPLECEWLMPEPGEDQTLDKERVNVSLAGNAAALEPGRVPDAESCRENAWYYDSLSAPERIIACPQTCDAIEQGAYTDVKILLGCETKVFVF
jgi:hypothetical protein